MGSMAAGTASPEGRTRPSMPERAPRRPAETMEEVSAPRDRRWPLYLIGTGLALSVAWSGFFVWGLTRVAGWMIG